MGRSSTFEIGGSALRRNSRSDQLRQCTGTCTSARCGETALCMHRATPHFTRLRWRCTQRCRGAEARRRCAIPLGGRGYAPRSRACGSTPRHHRSPHCDDRCRDDPKAARTEFFADGGVGRAEVIGWCAVGAWVSGGACEVADTLSRRREILHEQHHLRVCDERTIGGVGGVAIIFLLHFTEASDAGVDQGRPPGRHGSR